MSVRIDWNKLALLPDDEDQAFERFCFHIAAHMFGSYGTVMYFYNTPGSEFYVEINKPIEYAGKRYSEGDVIGWQAKYWKGGKDDANSPLTADHIRELEEGFNKTVNYQSCIKLWIICTPGSFVQTQWDKLIEKLLLIKSICSFESWHKDIFEELYLSNVSTYNGIFQYYFGSKFIGKEQLDLVSEDTLSCLKSKFDVDLHTPSDFEHLLLSIVDDGIASKRLNDKIISLYNHLKDDTKKCIFEESHWGYELLTARFKEAYLEDFKCRYELIERLYTYVSVDMSILEHILEISNILLKYRNERRVRVDVLNLEMDVIYKTYAKKEYSVDYYLSELANRVKKLEDKLTGNKEEDGDSIWYLINLLNKNDFSIFAEAGFGKTHFACSVARNLLDRQLPVLFLTGSQFRNCHSCSSKLIELLALPMNSTIVDIMDALDFIGKIYGCKLPIIIDGLNETAPNEGRWRDELPPLRRKVRERKHLLLITTCREKEDYINLIYGCENYKMIDNPIHLIGIAEKNLNNATELYFKKYDIHPINNIVHNNFNNPLLLKIFCVTNRGRRNFVLNDYSLASCMKEYSEQLMTSITLVNGRADRLRRHRIEIGLNKIAQIIWDKNERSLNFFDEFTPVFGDTTEKFLDEGMCFMLDRVGSKEQIQFSYDMVAGYHIAKSIVDQCKDETVFCQYIENYYNRLFGKNRHTLAEDISKSLFYQVPLMYRKEWFELMPNEEIVVSVMDHLDIIVSTYSGRSALCKLLDRNVNGTNIKKRMCESLFKRICDQYNLLYLSLFFPFFKNLDVKELDLYWNSKFSGYHILEYTYSLLNDEYWSDRCSGEDKIMLAALMCGITDREFRSKFHFKLLYLVELNVNFGLTICEKILYMKDPFIFESIISVITGVGLRTHELTIVNRCIDIMEVFFNNYASNHIVLLDNLETLYSYGKNVFGQTYNKERLYQNYDEEWPISTTNDILLQSMFDYDYEKFNIRPLFKTTYGSKSPFDSKDIFGMLLTRIKKLGYDEKYYIEMQKNEDEKVRYRRDLRCSYAHKYGRHALMELYGWMMMHLYIDNEYKETFRSSIIDIDPSQPKFSPMRTLVSCSFIPRDLSELPYWVNLSNIEYMSTMFHTKLPKKEGDWILMKGRFQQKIDCRHANLYMSGTSHLIPAEMDDETASKLDVDDTIDYNHVFANELGWRSIEFTEEYDYCASFPILIVEYSFSSWDSERFRYRNFFCLNPEITKKIGLVLDITTMSYYLNGEKVSEYYINEADHFFYLRKDIVDTILEIFDARIHHHIYERRMVDSDLPDNVPNIFETFKQNEIDVFYDK